MALPRDWTIQITRAIERLHNESLRRYLLFPYLLRLSEVYVGSEDKENSEEKMEGARSHHMYVPQDSQNTGPPKGASFLTNLQATSAILLPNYT